MLIWKIETKKIRFNGTRILSLYHLKSRGRGGNYRRRFDDRFHGLPLRNSWGPRRTLKRSSSSWEICRVAVKERALLNASPLVPFGVFQGHQIHRDGIPRICRDRDKCITSPLSQNLTISSTTLLFVSLRDNIFFVNEFEWIFMDGRFDFLEFFLNLEGTLELWIFLSFNLSLWIFKYFFLN